MADGCQIVLRPVFDPFKAYLVVGEGTALAASE